MREPTAHGSSEFRFRTGWLLAYLPAGAFIAVIAGALRASVTIPSTLSTALPLAVAAALVTLVLALVVPYTGATVSSDGLVLRRRWGPAAVFPASAATRLSVPPGHRRFAPVLRLASEGRPFPVDIRVRQLGSAAEMRSFLEATLAVQDWEVDASVRDLCESLVEAAL
jgi:hypothetical protein